MDLYQGAFPTQARAFGTSVAIGYSWVRSEDFVRHEYTHNEIFKLYNDSFIDEFNDLNSEAFAMDEAFPDFFTAVATDDAIIGETTGASRDLNNSLTMADWVTDKPQLNGRILSGALWTMQNNQEIWWEWGAPSNYLDKITEATYGALNLAPLPTTFDDFVPNFIDSADYLGYGGDINYIYDHFCERDIGSTCGSSKRDADGPKTTTPFSVQAFPSPADKLLKLRYTGAPQSPLRLEVFDVLGRLVLDVAIPQSGTGFGEQVIDVEDLAPGVYVIRVAADEDHPIVPVIVR